MMHLRDLAIPALQVALVCKLHIRADVASTLPWHMPFEKLGTSSNEGLIHADSLLQ